MEVRLFGPLEVLDDRAALAVRGAKQRALLAILALHRGVAVSADRLIDLLWGDGAAAHPANALQAQIRQLRRTLGADAVVTTEAGYALHVDDLDIARFEDLVGKGCRLVSDGDLEAGSSLLGEALGLRRGEPLAEFVYAGFGDSERAHLGELALVAVEARAAAELALGRHRALAGELEQRCRQHPLRERLWELLIVALYRDGRQGEALRAYGEARDRLIDELGIEPGPALRALEGRVLAQDPSLIVSTPPVSSPAAAVTVAPLLATKLHVPRQSRGVVARPRLNDRISGAGHTALTLVSAPAGFGKTTLLTEWLSTLPPGRPSIAWLSLDEGDNDPALFWTYVVTAFSDAVGGPIGGGALSLLQSSQAPLDAVLAT
ncbi:MAG: BTAD domain-containing putative transcriptional regulator, partial [Acidimicrobiales bacterium]